MKLMDRKAAIVYLLAFMSDKFYYNVPEAGAKSICKRYHKVSYIWLYFLHLYIHKRIHFTNPLIRAEVENHF